MGLSEVLLDFSGWTSAHGVPHIGQTKFKFFKFVWLLIVLTSIGFLCYNVSQLVKTYLSNPVNTNVELRFGDLTFPAISFCNVNNYKIAKMKEIYGTPNSSSALGILQNTLPMADSLLYSVYGKNINNQNFLSSLGHQLREMVVNCRFGKLACNMSDFKTWVDPYYGNCFTFNFNSQYVVYKSGAVDGLFMEIDINKTQYLSTTQVSGIKVVIHNPSEDPFPDTNGHYAAVGSITSLAMKMISSLRQPAPFGNCVYGKSDVPTFWYTGSYTREACQRSCYQKRAIEMGCADPQYPQPFANATYCTNGTVLAKAMVNINSYECVKFCGLHCEETSYLTSLSNAYFPSETYNASTCNDPLSAIEKAVLGPNQTITSTLGDVTELLTAVTGLLEQLTSLVQPLLGKRKKRGLPLLGLTSNGSLASLLESLMSASSVLNVLGALTPVVDLIKKELCLLDVQTSRLQLQVYYDSLSYQYVSESPGYGLVNLISDCGGQLGLWLGFSVITAIEVLTLFAKLFLEGFRCQRKAKLNASKSVSKSAPLGLYENSGGF